MQVYQLATICTLNHYKSELQDPQRRNRLSQPHIVCNLFPIHRGGPNLSYQQESQTWVPLLQPSIITTGQKATRQACSISPKTLTLPMIYSIPFITPWIFRIDEFFKWKWKTKLVKVNCLSCWSLAEQVVSQSWLPVPQEPSPLGSFTQTVHQKGSNSAGKVGKISNRS